MTTCNSMQRYVLYLQQQQQKIKDLHAMLFHRGRKTHLTGLRTPGLLTGYCRRCGSTRLPGRRQSSSPQQHSSETGSTPRKIPTESSRTAPPPSSSSLRMCLARLMVYHHACSEPPPVRHVLALRNPIHTPFCGFT